MPSCRLLWKLNNARFEFLRNKEDPANRDRRDRAATKFNIEPGGGAGVGVAHNCGPKLIE